MAASGIGPDPETFGFMLRSVEQAEKEKARVTLFCHFPVFNGEIGVDGTPNSVDTLKGDVDWAFRLFTWWKNYNESTDGQSGPVVDTVFDGHDHHSGAFSFKIEMETPERERELRGKLSAIFEAAKVNPKNINHTGQNVYEAIEDLVNEFDLKNNKLQIKNRGTTEKGIGLMTHFNHDPKAFSNEDGTLFVNVPAAGPPSSSAPPGYLKVSMDYKGHFKSLMPRFIQLEPTGEIFTATGLGYKAVKLEHQKRIDQWRQQQHLPIGKEYDAIIKEMDQRGDEEDDGAFEFGNGDSSKESVVDYVPLFCQYPKSKMCLSAGISPGFSLLTGALTADYTVAQLNIPLSTKYHPIIGFNELLLGAIYSSQTEQWLSETGFNLGILHPAFVTNFKDTHGFTLKAESPIPGFSLFGRALYNEDNPQGSYILGIDWTPALMSLKL
ncbi:MAG: hypothetical protein ACD_73C00732G0001 [uncultured bacterium]|nr:MAG: hypothetical protein ACD_73C00732G0001 [uncultured bacterium]